MAAITYWPHRTVEERDAELRAALFTGIVWDPSTMDYAVWQRGVLLGWAPTYHAGERRLAGLD